MRVLTAAEMKKCDQETIAAGYPEILLMEAAAYGAAESVKGIIENEKFSVQNKIDLQITILAGKGNNGGDGIAAARILKNWGYKPNLILASKEDRLTGLAKDNFKFALFNDLNYYEYEEMNPKNFAAIINNSHIIVDSLLGTGIKGKLRGNIKDLVYLTKENKSKDAFVVAVDIPTGVNSLDGSIANIALEADETATMAAYKRGLLLYPGRDYAGKIKIIKIGIKKDTINKNSEDINVLDHNLAQTLIPERSNYGHKGDFGKAAVLAGSRGMTGAPILSSEAALRTGTGLVYLLTPAEIEAQTSAQLREVVGIPLESENGIITAQSSEKILNFSQKVDVLAAGPGLSSGGVQAVIEKILKEKKKTLVLDADAINAIKDLELLKKYSGEIVLTPHPGEMSRLINKSTAEINNNRLKIARNFAQEYNLTLLLKGAATVIASASGKAFINTSGCNGMATAGSGDVLTGIITALISQGLSGFEAAVLAAYVHGKAGEEAAAKKSNFALMAGDIIENMPDVWKSIVSN